MNFEFLKKYKDRSFFILPILVFIFWSQIYPYHLLYQEKITLFLYRSDFFTSKLLHPGGLSEYLGSYFTQFFTSPWITGVLLTFIFIIIFILTSNILRKTEIIKFGYAFCWLPSLALLGMQTHYNFFLSESLKVLFFYALIYIYVCTPYFPIKHIFFIIAAPLFFTILGGGFYSIVYLVFILLQLNKKNYNLKFTIAYLIIGIALPLTWKYFIPISNKELYSFFNLSSINNWPTLTFIIVAFLPTMLLLKKTRLLSFVYLKSIMRKIGLLLNYILIFYTIYQLIHYCYHPQVEKVLHIEYAAMEENWTEILEIGKQYEGKNPSAIVLTNLALAKEGMLNEKLFDYNQIGINGLIHPLENIYFFNFHNHQVFEHLGSLNESFHWLFESYISELGIYSPYILKKVASQLIEYGKFQAAKSYLLNLLYTPQFGEWAKTTLRTLPQQDIPIKISSSEQDFITNVMGPFNDLINMAQNNPQNEQIRDYLLIGLLLEKQLEDYYNFFKFYYQSNSQEKKLPKVYEEALFLIYNELDKDVLNNFNVSIETKKLFDAYTQYINNQQIPRMKIIDNAKEKYKNTLWYYYHFSN